MNDANAEFYSPFAACEALIRRHAPKFLRIGEPLPRSRRSNPGQWCNRKLTDAKERLLMEEVGQGCPNWQIALKWGVHPNTVMNIKKRQRAAIEGSTK